MDEQLIESFLDRKNVFAVVGVSRDPTKYGHRVYRDLRSAGYKVYAINPNVSEILGDKCYPSLEALPVKPDVVYVVVPPRVTEAVVKTCKKLGIKKVWMQPGSESEKAIEFCEKNDIEVVYGVCVMIERAKRCTEEHKRQM
jgi:predicted CoA-binding protein